MRGPISDTELPFATALPLRANLPGMLLDDELLMALCAALDDLLAPAVAALDCFGAYLDPGLAPEDFLGWLAALVGSEPSRPAIAAAVPGYADRGTATGLRECAAAAAGVPVEQATVVDPGGVSWSASAGSTPPPAAGAARIALTAPAGADTDALSAAVRAAVDASRPVHCPLEIEVMTS
jgi:phage tail-like protein